MAMSSSALMPGMTLAGTTVIEIKTEGSGDIVRVSGGQNHNGAMVCNGTQWVVNSTWAHKYFVDTTTELSGIERDVLGR